MNIKFLAWKGYQLAPCESTSSGIGGSGSIELEYDWQTCAIPVQYGYWDSVTHKHIHDGVTQARFKNYVMDQIDDLYGPGAVEVANTYPGDLQAFLSYVVGSTPPSSPNNFQMVYADGPHLEISGFWIKMTTTSGIVITWGGE